MRRLRPERGAALVETPLAVTIVLLLGFAFLTLTQIVWTHLDLSSSVGGAVRFASRAEWVPESGTIDRRRSPEEVVAEWRQHIADEVGVDVTDVEIALDRDPRFLVSGDEIVVTVSTNVTNPVYRTAAAALDGLLGVVGADGPFDPDGVVVKAEASAYIE